MLVKALSKDAKLIILDEPTTALTPSEVQRLMHVIFDLKNKGISFIFISHMMDELIQLCDRVVILRDGQKVDEFEKHHYDRKNLSNAIAGKTLVNIQKNQRSTPSDEIALSLRDYRIKKASEPINFDVKKGEIISIAGLAGSGRSELIRSLFASPKAVSGQMKIYGKDVSLHSAKDAIKSGIGYLPDDRKTLGLFPQHDIQFNLGIASIEQWGQKTFIQKKKLAQIAEKYRQKIHIKCEHIHAPISSLSGGNQQKVLLARWFSTQPKIMLLNEPTRGVDIGAKSEILELIITLSAQGYTFIITSSELEEIIILSHKVLVMNKGKIAATLTKKDITKERIIHYSA